MATTRRAAAGGFTIIEVMIAIVILSVGLLGLTATSAAVTRMMSSGQRAELGALLAMQRMERSRPAACIPAQRVNGSETINRGTAPLARITWTFTDAGNQSIRVRVIADVVVRPNRWRTDTLETSVTCLI